MFKTKFLLSFSLDNAKKQKTAEMAMKKRLYFAHSTVYTLQHSDYQTDKKPSFSAFFHIFFDFCLRTVFLTVFFTVCLCIFLCFL